MCQRCGDIDGMEDFCGNEFFRAWSTQGTVDAIAVPETDVAVHRTLGDSGGNLREAAGNLAAVDYSLDFEHRAYVFDGQLDALDEGHLVRLGPGTEYVALPNAGDGAFTTVPFVGDPLLGEADWSAVRVYDIGACSVFIEWDRLVHLAAFEILSEQDLLDPTAVVQLFHMETSVAPQIAAFPRFGAIPLGPLESADAFQIRTRFKGDIKGCVRDTEYELGVSISLRAEYARIPSSRTATLDTVLPSRVGCDFETRDGSPVWVCDLIPGLGADGLPLEPQTYVFTSTPGSTTAENVPQLSGVGCLVEGDEWVCQLPIFSGAAITALPEEVRYRRRLLLDYSNKQIVAHVVDEEFSTPRLCWYSALGRARLKRALVGGDGATSSLPAQVSRFLNNAAAGLGLQPRRVTVMPEGLQIVVAESADDPQFVTANALAMLPGSTNVLSCNAIRRPHVDPAHVVRSRVMERSRTRDRLPSLNAAPVCDHDAQACGGICVEFGLPCDEGALYTVYSGRPGPGAGESCYSGQCCLAGEVCDGACDRDFRTDPDHCGSCGNACPSDEVCHLGSCKTCAEVFGLDGIPMPPFPDVRLCTGDSGLSGVRSRYCAAVESDASDCGGCGIMCEAGTSCVDSECVP